MTHTEAVQVLHEFQFHSAIELHEPVVFTREYETRIAGRTVEHFKALEIVVLQGIDDMGPRRLSQAD